MLFYGISILFYRSIFIASFATVVGAPVGIVNASFSLAFSIFTGIVKKTVEKNKK